MQNTLNIFWAEGWIVESPKNGQKFSLEARIGRFEDEFGRLPNEEQIRWIAHNELLANGLR